MGAKFLVIGYDGGTSNVIEPLMEEARLPIFTELTRNGVYGDLQSVFPPISAAAWASFMTGKNPGKHSVYNFVLKKGNAYYIEPAISTSIQGMTLWKLLSLKKKRIAVINVPLTYPPTQVNGLMISGLGTPSGESNFIYPGSFAQELRNAIPDLIMDVGWTGYEDENLDKFFEGLNYVTQKTYDVARYCIRKEEWDVFVVVFIGPDRIQHRLWNSIVNESCSGHLKKRNIGDKAKEYFGFLDHLIGNLIKESGDNSNVVVLSDHGFGPFIKDIDLNNWLAKEGFLKYSSKGLNAVGYLTNYAKILGRNLGLSKEWVLKKLGKRMDIYKYLEKSSPQISDINWAETKAFCLSSHLIHLNLRGRERYGIINPGEEYENLRSEIIDKLCSLRDPETNCQVVKKVQRTEEIYYGNNREQFPDLIITEYDEAGYIGADRIFSSEKDDRIFMKTAKTQEGVHRLNGFFIATGENIKKGQRTEGATIMDIFPTILFMLGINIPNDIDGKVLMNIFEKTISNPRFEPGKEITNDPYSLSDDEKSKMIKNLKNLGYL